MHSMHTFKRSLVATCISKSWDLMPEPSFSRSSVNLILGLKFAEFWIEHLQFIDCLILVLKGTQNFLIYGISNLERFDRIERFERGFAKVSR